jgi:DNA-binding NarL/FixJ family response regulator
MLAQGSAGVYPPDSSVAAAALDCIDRGIVVTEPFILIAIHDTHAAQCVDARTLQQLYALTPMQADIAAALFAGYTVEQLTQRLRISQNTVRTHLKGVFKKCAVRSQAQLMRLLALGPR